MPVLHVAGHELVEIRHPSLAFHERSLHGQHISEALRHTKTAGSVGVDLCGPNDGGGNRAGHGFACIVWLGYDGQRVFVGIEMGRAFSVAIEWIVATSKDVTSSM